MSGMMLSPDSDHSRYDSHMNGHSLAICRPKKVDILAHGQSKQPHLAQTGQQQQNLHESQFFMLHPASNPGNRPA